jgi:hypothetical protein
MANQELNALCSNDIDTKQLSSDDCRVIESPRSARSNSGERMRSLWHMVEAKGRPVLCRIYSHEPACVLPFSQSGVLANRCYSCCEQEEQWVVDKSLRRRRRGVGGTLWIWCALKNCVRHFDFIMDSCTKIWSVKWRRSNARLSGRNSCVHVQEQFPNESAMKAIA